MAVDTQTGEVIEFRSGERVAQTTPEQLHMLAEGMGRFENVPKRTVLVETQNVGGNALCVTLEVVKGPAFCVSIEAPDTMTVYEAETLRGMLDRAVKAAKAAGE